MRVGSGKALQREQSWEDIENTESIIHSNLPGLEYLAASVRLTFCSFGCCCFVQSVRLKLAVGAIFVVVVAFLCTYLEPFLFLFRIERAGATMLSSNGKGSTSSIATTTGQWRKPEKEVQVQVFQSDKAREDVGDETTTTTREQRKVAFVLSKLKPGDCAAQWVSGFQPGSYFEVTINKLVPDKANHCVAIGVASDSFPLKKSMPGWKELSWGYHGDDGHVFHNSGFKSRAYGPSFGEGDTIGCGMRDDGQSIFFTKNGISLGVAFPNIGQQLTKKQQKKEKCSARASGGTCGDRVRLWGGIVGEFRRPPLFLFPRQ
jgi:hypothetical protein